MAWDYAPWMIGNNVEHTVEVARLLAHAGTGGAEGIVTPGDCKVQPLNTPGTKVRIAPGAVLLKNRYPGGQQQTYVGRNTSELEVSVTATGSGGGRSDLVVARVLDPQYEGQEPSDPNDFEYMRTEIIEDIPSSTKRFDELGLDYPAVALARIDLPASTGTVESEHITDLRRMALPRRAFEVRTYALDDGDDDRLDSSSSDGEVWPNAAVIDWDPGIWVPEWATRARVVCTWAGIYQPSGYARGNLWVQIGGYSSPPETKTQVVRYQSADSNNPERNTAIVADDIPILEEHRGSYQRFYPKGYRASGVGASERPVLDAASALVLQVDFYEDIT